ncbi:DNA mismatch repair endonuclease MutL, partial [Enterobacteriaceae endosymbiont of Donacia piscatrix]|uniref:DNA mismatch repair endonuclease MutL n=1 Tax=Enterobacteriaceae endosymbiont of Donacia piscatrix TaxID=2675780 RepID=UPI00144A2030
MSIKILPKNIIKKIAAGEVIDRPATIVKELIENSIDAKASQINLHIEKGGKYIYINDNGIGMNKKNLILCIKKYATSKINNLDSFNFLNSFGFRGEALTSIKSVSRMTIISKTLKQPFAWQLYTEGFNEQIFSLNPISHPIGTTIIISDVFYNLPAKRLCLLNDKIEFIYIKNIIKKIILMKLGIGIKFKYQNKVIYNFKKVTDNISYINRIKVIFGNNFLKNSLEINANYKKLKLYGRIMIFDKKKKPNNLFKYFYVNNRIINNNFLYRTIKETIQNKFNQNYIFSFLLYLEIESNKIDINIHPKKTDIRFYDTILIYNFIYKNITKILYKNNFQVINQNKKIYILKEKNEINIKYSKYSTNTESILMKNIIKQKIVYLDNKPNFYFKNFGKFLTIIKNNFIIIKKNDFLYSIIIKTLFQFFLKKKFQLIFQNKNIINNFKINIKINITKKEYSFLYKIKQFLLKLGFNFSLNNKNVLHIMYVP